MKSGLEIFVVVQLLLAPMSGWTLPRCPAGMPATHPQRATCHKEWTVMIYMAADNDLDAYAVQDLQEIFLGKSDDFNESFDVVIEIDRAPPIRGSQRITTTRSGHHILQLLPEKNSGSIEIFENFLDWALINFPSQKTALVMWGHGNGWLMSEDQSSRSWLSAGDIRKSLSRTLKQRRRGQPLDIFVADSCFGQTLETIYELKDQTLFIYGSVPVMDRQGIPYDKLFKHFAEGHFNNQNGGHALAKFLPNLIKDHYRGLNDRLMSSSFSTLSLQQAQRQYSVWQILDRFAELAVEWIDEDSLRGLEFIAALGDVVQFKTNIYDLYQATVAWNYMLSRQEQSPNVLSMRRLLTDLQNHIQRGAVNYFYGSGYLRSPLAGWAKGVSIWLPNDQKSFETGIKTFGTSLIMQKSHWPAFLKRLY